MRVEILARQRVLGKQFLVARQRQLGTFQQRLILVKVALILRQRRLVAARINLRQQLPGADFLPLFEVNVRQLPVTVTVALGMTVPSAVR